MPTRGGNPRITIQADATPVDRAARQGEQALGRLEKSAHKTGEGLKVGLAAGAVAATAGLGAVVDQLHESEIAARASEVSQSKLEAQLKAMGVSYKAHAKQIDEVIQKTSRLSGLDDEDLQDAFTNVVRATGNVNGALKDMAVVADLARAKHLDVAKAGDLVAKVHNGNVGVLKRYGVAIDPVTKAQDKLKASTKHATDEQVRAAKEQDKQATAQKALAELTDRFSGQAKKYGDTTQGAMDKASVAWENLHEAIGAKVTPVLAKAALAFVGLLDKASSLGPTVKRIAGDVTAFGQRVIAAFRGGQGSAGDFATKVRSHIQMVIGFVRDLYTRVKAVFSNSGMGGDLVTIGRAWLKFQGVVLQAVDLILKRILPPLATAVTGLATIVRGVVRIIAGVLSGNWAKAWQGAKDVASGAVTAIVAIVKGLGGLLLDAAKAGGKAVIKGLAAGLKAAPGLLVDALVAEVKFAVQEAPKLLLGALKGLGGAITKGITSGFGKLNPFGDGIGMPSGGSTALSGGNALMGARSILAPFASAAGRFGLHTTSGARPGAITISGNRSYHADGYAIDESGSPAGMLAYFRYLKATAGAKLRELIYTPGGIGIKDGKPYQYTGAVAAQHMDHVHVAYTGGIGDGIGFSGLEQLWVQAGGSQNLAPLMAHIAQAESGGDPTIDSGGAHNRPDGGSRVAAGLWQILGKPFAGNVYDPLTNAKMAVWKYAHQGLGAWAASRGTWGRFVGSGETYSPGSTTRSTGKGKTAKTYKPGISNEPLGSLRVTGEDASADATALLTPTYTFGAPRPIKGYRPTDPISEPVDKPEPVIPGVQTEFSDTIRAQAALAALTPGTDDDLTAANAGVWNAQIALDRAKASGNQGAIADTAEALKSAIDAVTALTDSINQANALQQQRDQLNQQIADNQEKILALGNRTGDLQAQFAAWLSGSIGGRVGLGFQAAGVPGSVARY